MRDHRCCGPRWSASSYRGGFTIVRRESSKQKDPWGPGILSGRHTTERPRRLIRFSSEVFIDAAPREVFDFCLRAENVIEILPERMELRRGSDSTGKPGGVYEYRYWVKGALPLRVVSTITHFDRPGEFVDLQLRGFFRYWEHRHVCRSADGGTSYEDSVEFASRFGGLIDRSLVKQDVKAMFEFRHARMKEILESG